MDGWIQTWDLAFVWLTTAHKQPPPPLHPTHPPTQHQNFLNEAVSASTEGLIVKTLDDVYQVRVEGCGVI